MCCRSTFYPKSHADISIRVRYQVSRVSAINFSMECSKLADIIKQYALKDENSMFVD